VELKPGQWYRLWIITVRDDRRDLLDAEFHVSQLGVPARLKLGDRQQDEIIEPVGPAAVQRHSRRD
jgi:hypothetical protein